VTTVRNLIPIYTKSAKRFRVYIYNDGRACNNYRISASIPVVTSNDIAELAGLHSSILFTVLVGVDQRHRFYPSQVASAVRWDTKARKDSELRNYGCGARAVGVN